MVYSQSLRKKTLSWILILSSIIYLTFAYIPSYASACSCAPPPDVKTALSNSDAVFSGKVISVNNKRTLKGYSVRNVLFEISQTWKGVNESHITVITGQGGGDCGIDFIVGNDYLVYSRESDMYGKKQLTTIMCDRTTELISANEDLSYLGKGESPTIKVDINKENWSGTSVIKITVLFVIGLFSFLGWLYFFKKNKKI